MWVLLYWYKGALYQYSFFPFPHGNKLYQYKAHMYIVSTLEVLCDFNYTGVGKAVQLLCVDKPLVTHFL